MADFSKKVQSANQSAANLVSAKFVHVDGSKASVPIRTNAGRLLKVVINTKGIAFVIRNGSEVIANFATTSAEGTYTFGIYANSNLLLEVSSGTGSVTVVHDS